MPRRDDDEAAQITRGQVAAYGVPTPDELAAINAMTRVPLTADDLYVVEMLPSDTSIDSYYTHQDAGTSLRNYAADAQAGLPVLLSHDSTSLPVGRTFAGTYVDGAFTTPRGVKLTGTPAAPVVYEAAYLPRGVATTSTPNDAIIRAIDTGVATDVSIRFGGPTFWYQCDECGRNMFTYTVNEDGEYDYCPHYPGQRMPETGGKAAHRATATVMDGRQLEVSPVWKGANGNAVMLANKAERLLVAGMLSHAELAAIDADTGCRVADRVDWERVKERRVIVAVTKKTDDTDTKRRATLSEALGGEENPGTATTPPPEAERADPTQVAAHPLVRLLTAEGIADEAGLRTLVAQAADGRRYREDLIDLCHQAGARANGAEYRREVHERMLAALPVGDLQDLLAERNAATRARFAPFRAQETPDPAASRQSEIVGGRQSVAGPGPLGMVDPGAAAPAERESESDARLWSVK